MALRPASEAGRDLVGGGYCLAAPPGSRAIVDSTFPIWNDRGMMILADLRAFARVADLGSVSGAARALGAPKSSVSRSLARLEATLRAALVERTTRGIRLTDAGRLLHPQARRILTEVEEAEEAVGGLVGVPRGLLRVTAPYAFVEGLIAPMLPGFLQRHPAVQVALDSDGRRWEPLVDEVDLAVRLGPLPDSDLVARRLTAFEIWYCASPVYLAARGTPHAPADLAGHDLVGREGRLARWTFRGRDGAAEDAVEVRLCAVLPEPTALRAALAAGGGIGRLPDFLAAPAIERGDLARVLARYEPDVIEAHVLYAGHRSLSAKVRAFVDALAAHISSRRGTRR